LKIQFEVPPSSASESNGVAVRYAAAKRQVPRWRWYLLLALVLAVPVYLLVRFVMAYLWASMPAQVMLEQATMRAPVSGMVTKIVPVGTEIRAGQVLAEVDALSPLATTAAASAPISVSGRVGQAQTARATLLAEAERLAQDRLAIQQERLRIIQDLYTQGAATRQEVDNLRFQELQAQADLSRARADVREYQAALERERAQSSSIEAPAATAGSNGLRVVLAPFDSMVHRTVVHKGDWVAQGAEIAVVQSKMEPLVYAYVPPDKERYAQVGKTAILRFMDGTKVSAKVVRVMPEAQSPPLERSAPFAPRTPAIVVCLQALQPLPAAYRIHQLPLDVRFDWVAGPFW